METLITGRHRTFIVDLTDDDGLAFVIDPGATVKAILREGNTALTSEVTCVSSSPADWTVAKVAVVFSDTVTAAIDLDDRETLEAVMEIYVLETVPDGWITSPIKIVKGLIT